MLCQLRLAYTKTAAGAVLALSASAANAGIIIPAGEWTVDISGNVNSFYSQVKANGTATVNGGLASGNAASVNSQGTGLLPNFLSFAGTTRQNDLDVTWLISIQPGGDIGASGGSMGTQNNRQAYFTFGDKSWGTVLMGKNIGIFAQDAILNDMTLLGVGACAGVGNATCGRIGTGFQYADWKSQVNYTTPNMNGFQATVGLTQGWNATATTGASSLATTNRGGGNPAYEGKASYSFSVNDVTGKVWVSGIAQKIGGGTLTTDDPVAQAADIGANVNVAGFGLTGYYYGGQGMGTTFQFKDGYSANGKARDSDGGYVQATYKLPTNTKLGIAWGESNLDANATGDLGRTSAFVKSQELWSAGLYHPLTKHLNLVAEYNKAESEGNTGTKSKVQSVSFGGILFF